MTSDTDSPLSSSAPAETAGTLESRETTSLDATSSAKSPAYTAALSPSRLKDFANCPLKFRFRTIDQIPEPPSDAALRGTLVHAVLEHLFDNPPEERTEERAQDSLIPTWQHHLTEHPDAQEIFANGAQITAWLESARGLLSTYFSVENPQYLEPVGREKYVRTSLPSGLTIHGYIDRIDQAPNGALRIVDYKTGKSPSPRFQSDYLFQMKFYAAALFYQDGILPARTQLIFLKDARVLTYDPHTSDVSTISATIESEWEKIKQCIDLRSFKPRRNKLCDWCTFHELCPAFGGVSPSIPTDRLEHLLTVENQAAAEKQPRS